MCQSRAVSCTPLPQVTWLAVSLAAHTMYTRSGCVVDMEHHSTLKCCLCCACLSTPASLRQRRQHGWPSPLLLLLLVVEVLLLVVEVLLASGGSAAAAGGGGLTQCTKGRRSLWRWSALGTMEPPTPQVCVHWEGFGLGCWELGVSNGFLLQTVGVC